MNYPIDITGVLLRSDRLILRPFEAGDLEDFYQYAKVPGVGEMAGWPHHENREVSQNILNSFIEGKKTLAIVHQQDQRVIGSVGIERYDEALAGADFAHLRCRELGFVLSRAYWRQGYMTEAVQTVMAYCFQKLKLDGLFCAYFLRNEASAGLQEKLGFTPLKKSVTLTTRLGKEEVGVLNYISREKWEEGREG